MKKLIIGLTGLVAVIVVAVVLMIGNLDKIIKGGIESVGSELTGVPVGVGDVGIELKNGIGQITGFTIANPSGFSSEQAFRMDMIRLGIDLGSLAHKPITLTELNIKNPIVDLEVKADGTSNLQTLLDNIEKNGAKADKKAAEQQAESEGGADGELIRLRIDKLSITGVTVKAVVPGQDAEIVIIPDIIMENVGDENGLTPAELGSVIIGKIIGESLKSALEKKMNEKIEEVAKGLFDDITKKFTSGKK